MDSSNVRFLRASADYIPSWMSKPAKPRNWRIIALLVATFLISSAVWTYYNLLGEYSGTPIFGSSEKQSDVIIDPGKSLIPEKIWQIIFKDEDCDPEDLRETKTWLAKNINCQYTLLGKEKSDEFVRQHYASEPRVIDVYEALWNTGMKSDLLRYLVLNIEGGVYADIDTKALKPMSKWVPPYLRDRIRLVAGIEFDRLSGNAWQGMPHYVQFGQWAFAGAAGHPVFRRLIDRAVEGIEDLARQHGVSVQELRPNKHTDVVNTTGPIAFTDMIIEEIRRVEPLFNDTKAFSPMTENVVVGDMLLLPIDAFGMGQAHSGSTNDGTIPPNALVQHLFWGHWTKGDQMGDDKKKPDQDSEDKVKDSEDKDDGSKDDKEENKEDGKKPEEEQGKTRKNRGRDGNKGNDPRDEGNTEKRAEILERKGHGAEDR